VKDGIPEWVKCRPLGAVKEGSDGATVENIDLTDSVSKAYTAIRSWIFEGELKPGQDLQEKQLGELIGVSRTPVRAALARLQNEGLVLYERYRRYTVVTLDGSELDRIFELRVELEGLAARRAANLITDDALEELVRIATQMEHVVECEDEDIILKFDGLNTQFHQIILKSAANVRLENMLNSLISLPLSLLEQYQPHLKQHFRRSCQHHREIIAALSQRNPDWAEAQMRSHILSVRRG